MFACNMCARAASMTDVVRVDLKSAPFLFADKENQPLSNVASSPTVQFDPAAEKRRYFEMKEAEERRRCAEAAAERAAEAERRQLALRRRLEEEAEEAARRREEEIRTKTECLAKQYEEEERLRKVTEMQREAEEAQRRRLEKEAAEQDRQARDAADAARLTAFLKEHGYSGANVKRTMLFKSKYPLHSAVKVKDADMIRILRAFGADCAVKNSAGQTPLQLAQKSDKNGSHEGVIAALG
eukprot:TRINITY_DN4490_c0_g1_i1.p1 TRINITY_DN4490_c0_g1~~TRINITY_DN4490_c0_g1_i1.p1  ORF type:complete len:240 (-),score=79.96 TRINITY_DN4490_c0_g1_i1:88-807(-)